LLKLQRNAKQGFPNAEEEASSSCHEKSFGITLLRNKLIYHMTINLSS